MSQSKHAAQDRFDNRYITGLEIQEELGVSRSLLLSARRRGMLPEPIVVKGPRCFIWERETVKPYIDAWRISLASRRKQLEGSV